MLVWRQHWLVSSKDKLNGKKAWKQHGNSQASEETANKPKKKGEKKKKPYQIGQSQTISIQSELTSMRPPMKKQFFKQP